MCLASFDEMWGKKHIIEGYELVVEFQVWRVFTLYHEGECNVSAMRLVHT